MLGLGFWEIVVIGIIALIVIGPERLPEFAKSVARFLNEMKRTAADLKTVLDEEKDIFKDSIDQFQDIKKQIEAPMENKKKEVHENIVAKEKTESVPLTKSENHHEAENQNEHLHEHEGDKS